MFYYVVTIVQIVDHVLIYHRVTVFYLYNVKQCMVYLDYLDWMDTDMGAGYCLQLNWGNGCPNGKYNSEKPIIDTPNNRREM